MLRRLFESANPADTVAVQATTLSHDLLGRYACATWDEVAGNGGQPFDVVVVGSGMFGGYCAEKLYRFGEDINLRILVLEAGAFLLSGHVQNFPRIPLGAPGIATVRVNGDDPGTRNVVWGSPWHSNQGFPGLAYNVGGRSIFWGGWSPRLTDADLAFWPPEVAADIVATYKAIEDELAVSKPTGYMMGPFGQKLMTAFGAAVGSLGLTVADAPLAIQGTAPEGALFSFDKYSSATLLIDAIREDIDRRWTLNDDSRRRLMLLPRAHVVSLRTDGTSAVRRIEVSVNGQQHFLNSGQELSPTFKLVLAAGTIETTRLALSSFPSNGMGSNLMAHIRSNTTVRITRAALGLPSAPSGLETAALIVRGAAPAGGRNRQFHLQVTAAASPGSNPESNMFTAIPDIDHYDQIRAGQDPNWVVIILRGIGEMGGDQTVAPPQGPKDLAKSWVNLAQNSDQLDEYNMPRAWVNLVPTTADGVLWDTMDKAAGDLALKLAGGRAANIQYFYDNAWRAAPPPPGKVRDGIGTTHHEAGTLWMGTDPASSLTDLSGRFHHIDNVHVAGPALFPTIGSANPSLTATALARRTARRIVESLTPMPSASPKALFTGTLAGWQMAGAGGFNVLGDVLESFAGLGLIWYTREQFANFALTLEWRASSPTDNSGVFIRFPALNSSSPANDWMLAVDHGYEIQIDDTGFNPDTNKTGDPRHQTGAVYGFAPSSTVASKPIGEWNSYDIQVTSTRIVVTLNGKKVTDFKVDGSRPAKGHIGLQNHTGRVQFRNIQIRSLA